MNVTDKLLLLTESSVQLYFSFDLDKNRFDYINPAFKRFFNIEDLSMPIPFLLAFVHPEDQGYIADQVCSCLAGQAVKKVECRIVTGTQIRHLRISAHLLSESTGQALMGYADDITDDKTQLNMISMHNAKKNSVLSILSHDLAGPIGNMQSLIEMLRGEALHWQNPNADEYINLIYKISNNCIKLIRNFLDHEFLESTGGKLVKKRVNLVEKIKIKQSNTFAIRLN